MRKYIYIIAALLTVSGIAVAYSLSTPGQPDNGRNTASPAGSDTPAAESGKSPERTDSTVAGVYTTYTEDSFSQSRDSQRLLFFHASWCIQCRSLDESIRNGTIPAGVTIFKVDYDSRQDLRQKYGVTIQTTVVSVDSDGTLIKKFVAYDRPTLDSIVTNVVQ